MDYESFESSFRPSPFLQKKGPSVVHPICMIYSHGNVGLMMAFDWQVSSIAKQWNYIFSFFFLIENMIPEDNAVCF